MFEYKSTTSVSGFGQQVYEILYQGTCLGYLGTQDGQEKIQFTHPIPLSLISALDRHLQTRPRLNTNVRGRVFA